MKGFIYFNNWCKNAIEDENLKYAVDFTVYGLHRDHPSAWELMIQTNNFSVKIG